MAFLADFSSDRPAELVELLQCRVERAEHADSVTEYRAVPFSWDHDLQVRGTNRVPESCGGSVTGSQQDPTRGSVGTPVPRCLRRSPGVLMALSWPSWKRALAQGTRGR